MMEQRQKLNNNRMLLILYLLSLFISNYAFAQHTEIWKHIKYFDTLTYSITRYDSNSVIIKLSSRNAFNSQRKVPYFQDTFKFSSDSNKILDLSEYDTANKKNVYFQCRHGTFISGPMGPYIKKKITIGLSGKRDHLKINIEGVVVDSAYLRVLEDIARIVFDRSGLPIGFEFNFGGHLIYDSALLEPNQIVIIKNMIKLFYEK